MIIYQSSMKLARNHELKTNSHCLEQDITVPCVEHGTTQHHSITTGASCCDDNIVVAHSVSLRCPHPRCDCQALSVSGWPGLDTGGRGSSCSAPARPGPGPRRVSPVAVSGPRHSPTTAASGALLSRIPTQTCRYVYGYTGRRSTYM